MNYSTLKKGLAASFVALIGVTTLANAQDASTSSSSAKVFGGRGQYRTWSLGVNGGVLSPFVAIGGSNDFTNFDVNLGYGISLRKQLGHAFGLEGNVFRGKVSGTNKDAPGGAVNGIREFETELAYATDLRGVVNVATVDFLRRENSVNFFVTAGYGVAAYRTALNGADIKNLPENKGDNGDKKYIKEAYIPVGAGIKFKVSERVSFNLGYTMHFIDGDNFDGVYAKATSKDKFSYGYAGLEFSLGSKSKPNLDWVNPLALMYDELKDPSLRQEVEALKNRVSNIEKSVEDLKKDSDGDGVADQFDKCPGTPAGTAVDGSGCPLPKAPEPTVKDQSTLTGFETIQFEFNSSVLKTDSYPTLDKLSSVLRENGGKVTVKGYASSEGTAAYNLKLSKDRANSVKTYLVNSGVNASQVVTKGYGEANPIASNDTEEGRIQNRRVESSRN
ncbi:OmpA family protein [Pedobacter heparinus]|uniref:OmpA/MotB domain protein n=1 Tax=Pedobacter heparinus (strain ATCC 13125 / DSM 2366 / CIP 104194 / JCM 7457 / NBRC 12017 / NCIMB 9290 / NRRL B-14731 / HIM 762-3) TaxID=485917 RepID=C6XYB3_PEDHD|nr:OmpA family protein [Pedobacter heparinus]ACU02380.1 OmpA/MotB domain protein [Pedobacter heparinus DSM 2366]